ncbi:MAG: TrmH family RNA methyltransferase [Candidatus Saccharibacteria bacterium]|nr:TrmH family RNA methyltransferase [Candidatus Saccharibacteria bacterium]
MEDTRNLIDEFKGQSNEQIFSELKRTRQDLEIAIENVEHDFNIGSIVRTANSFNVARVHIIGKKKYNRRGAMCTDKYLEIVHHPTIEEFLETQKGRELVAIENNTPRAKPLHEKVFLKNTTLIFGSENSGITQELIRIAHDVRYIESFGSTRSVNVGAAAAIAMYEWTRQNRFANLDSGSELC